MKTSLEYWRHCTTLTLSEAALLITENYPEDWSDERLLSSPPTGFRPIFGQMLVDVVTVVKEAVLSQEYEDVYYPEYALMIDKPAQLTKLTNKERLAVKVEKDNLLRWLELRNIHSRFFEDKTLRAFQEDETPIPALNPTDPCYPPELNIAIRAWSAVSASTGKGKAKARIRKWLDENYPDKKELSIAARERISVVVNWDNRGGPEKSE